MTTYGALLTTAGANKLAAAASGGPGITLSALAVGDANGTAYAPNQAQTSLVNEVYRATIASYGYVTPGTIQVEAVIPANTPDGQGRASGGFQILELGLFDSTGTLIAVANTPAVFKPLPSSGAAADLTIRMLVVIGTAATVTVAVDTGHTIPVSRLDRLPFLAVDSATTTAPPATPELGATYVIPAGATGVWAGQTNKIAHWNGSAWIIVTPFLGTVVSIGANLNFEVWDGASWDPLPVPSRYATDNGAVNALAITLSPAVTALTAGLKFRIAAKYANTGPATINVNGLGAVTILRKGGVALKGGEWAAADIIDLTYDGAHCQIGSFAFPAYAGSTNSGSSAYYQVLPNGLILQWASGGTIPSGAHQDFVLPLTFPTQGIYAGATLGAVGDTATPVGCGAVLMSAGVIRVYNNSQYSLPVNFFAVGF